MPGNAQGLPPCGALGAPRAPRRAVIADQGCIPPGKGRGQCSLPPASPRSNGLVRNGVATRGLLFMEKSWDAAYLRENAEAALAYFEAAKTLRSSQRAIAKHLYGPHGFLTEGVDWNNHVGQQHHIGQQRFAAIQYTEPFLNNQHIVEPTLFYLRHLAKLKKSGPQRQWEDLERNRIYVTSSPGY